MWARRYATMLPPAAVEPDRYGAGAGWSSHGRFQLPRGSARSRPPRSSLPFFLMRRTSVIAVARASWEPPFFDVVRASVKLITAPEVDRELINLFRNNALALHPDISKFVYRRKRLLSLASHGNSNTNIDKQLKTPRPMIQTLTVPPSNQ